MAIDIHNLLADAFLELCEQKPLASITIKDLLVKTGVSRQAFYNRFHDKNDLIQWIYKNKVLKSFIQNGYENSYYYNTLLYYRAIDAHRNFLKQACAIRDQNCLFDYMLSFVIEYDTKWHQHLNGNNPLSPEQKFITDYYAIASINVAIQWISCNNPEPPEIMARRLTSIRKTNMSEALFGKECTAYDIPEEISASQ